MDLIPIYPEPSPIPEPRPSWDVFYNAANVDISAYSQSIETL